MSVGTLRVDYGGTIFWFDFRSEYIDVDEGTIELLAPDLWNAIKIAQWSPRGRLFAKIANGEGYAGLGTVRGDVIETFITVTLLGDWEIRSRKTGGKFTVAGGNVVKKNGLDPFVDNPLVTHFLILSQTGTISRVNVGSAVTPADKTEIITGTKDAILSDGVAFQGARIDAAVSSRALPGEGLTAGEKLLLAGFQEVLYRVDSLTAVLYQTQGLDPENPATVGPDGVTAGALRIRHDYNAETDVTVMTRES